MAPEICPNCGAAVPRNAKACPECGADEETGWSEAAYQAPLDLPGGDFGPDSPSGDFDYDEFVEREFGNRKRVAHRLHWYWWVAAVLALAAFVTVWVLR